MPDPVLFCIGFRCAPGGPPPEYYFKRILRGTGLKASDFHKPATWNGGLSLWRLRLNEHRKTRFLFARHRLCQRLSELVDNARTKVCRAHLVLPSPYNPVRNQGAAP